MASLLALLSAATFGAGDFLGGLATRRSGPATTVVFVAHLVGLIFLGALSPLFGFDAGVRDVVIGALGGLAGVVGLVLLYRGLAIGTMSVVAPITALGAAVIPVGFGLIAGERPAAWALVGAVIALLAIYLVSQPGIGDTGSTEGAATRGLPEAIGAGIGFGVFFILLAETATDSGLVPLVAARVASVTALGLLTVSLGRRLWLQGDGLRLALAAGIFDAAANALFLAAARTGLLSLVAVLSALYPASTIILARIVLRERISRVQQLGLVAGLAGVVLIAAA
ncbi:MAG: DMT family transporter [Acidimicrobiia bacterium]|nr:DMT family transporter [Acidimicrobiia bacterium]